MPLQLTCCGRRPDRRGRPPGTGEAGFAMPWVMLLLILALSMGAATLRGSLLDTQTTQANAFGNKAFAAAEAGLVASLNAINRRGIIDFQNDVVNAGILPTTATTVSPTTDSTYEIAVVSGINTATEGQLTVTGRAPLSAERQLRVKLVRGDFVAGAGALHLSNDTATGTFSGASMVIDGNNHRPDGTLDPSVMSRPGISMRNDTVRTALVGGLSANQQGAITGAGASPSVITTGASSTSDILRLIDDILAKNSGAINTISSKNIRTQDFLGTAANPAVTYLSNANPSIAGDATGYGILIVDQNVEFKGNFSFTGWVLFRNPSANGISIGGSVLIQGTVWSPLPAFAGNGGITVNYCQQCLTQYADKAGLGSTNGGNLPRPVVVVSWAEL